MDTGREARRMAPTNLEPDQNLQPRVIGKHVSFSQLSMYLLCSMKYYYAYILRLRSKSSIALAVGSGGHTALEYNGRQKIRTGKDLSIPDILDLADTFIEYEVATELEDVNQSEKGEAKDRALRALQVYQTRDAAAITPAGVEVEFMLDLNEPNLEPLSVINGKIDLITTKNAVVDYKFTSRAKSQNDVDLSPQLTLYGKVFHTLTGRYATSTGFQQFLPGSTRTPPDARALMRVPELMAPEAQEARFRRLAFQFRRAEQGIRKGIFIPTDDPRACSWCGYRDRCQMSLVDDFEAAAIRGDN